MASQNKKRKAKNSYLSNGGEKLDGKNKRIMYYTKRQRKKLKAGINNIMENEYKKSNFIYDEENMNKDLKLSSIWK